MSRQNRPRSTGSLGRDFGIFSDPGFLVTLFIMLAIFAAGVGILLYTNSEYGIWPLWRATGG